MKAWSEFLAPKKPTANNTLKETKCREIISSCANFDKF